MASLDTAYEIHFLFLCEDAETAEYLDREVVKLSEETFPGMVPSMIVQVTSETRLSDLAAYVRLSEWDYLSNLGELGERPRGL